MTPEDEKEIKESIELVQENADAIVGLDISGKPYILIGQDNFNNLINEVNQRRIAMSDQTGEVELIMPIEDVEDEES